MKIGLWKKGLVFGIILLFVGAGVIPSFGGTVVERNSNHSISNGNTLYVGGSGPGNYTRIQDAIDNASNRDIVFVYNGTYYEYIDVTKSINLIGENKETTIIDGGGSGDVVNVTANNVKICELTIQNSGDEWRDAGIRICSNRNIIKGNNIKNNNNGIYLHDSKFNIIKGNIISNNDDGLILRDNRYIVIIKNNFLDNKQDAFFYNSFLTLWWRNYWNESRILPKLMHGEIIMSSGVLFSPTIRIKWFNIDFRPALRPYKL